MGFSRKIIEELSGIVELLPREESSKYERDRWCYFGLQNEQKAHALAVARPKDEEEVAKILQFCQTHDLGVTVRGGGSSVTGSSAALNTLVIDMTKLSKIVQIDQENLVINVQAGAKLSEIESHLNEEGLTLGQFPQSFHLTTIGGFLSTMGTGEFSGKYGGIENSCISLRVALADGSIVETQKTQAPRFSTGPDLSRLFIGAEGTLGVILSAKLRIHRMDNHTLKLAFRFNNFSLALKATKTLLELDIHPAVCRVYNEQEASFMFGEAHALMLLIYSFKSQRVMKCIEDEVKRKLPSTAGQELSTNLVDKWLDLRFKYDEQLGALEQVGYTVETAELGVPWSTIGALYKELLPKLLSIEGVAGVGAHVSHIYHQGACLYLTIVIKKSTTTYTALWNEIEGACRKHNATVSHHHGVGMLKSQMIKKEVAYELLLRIKRTLDPKNMLNPNKML